VDLPEEALRFLQRPGLFATLATINSDGAPLQSVIWYVFTGEGFLVNSREGRRWPTNLRHDPRAHVAVEDGYDWVGARCEAELVAEGEAAQAHIAALARRYRTEDPKIAEREIARFRQQQRVSFMLRPRSFYVHLDVD
jgi:PPOX class probable F420-dependent enzyme